MTRQDIYKKAFAETLYCNGIAKKEAAITAETVVGLQKNAEFSLSDYLTDEEGNIRWSNILIPLGLALGTGFMGYRSGINGDPSRSALSNFKNYTIGTMRNLVRHTSSYPMYNSKLHKEIAAAPIPK